MVKFRLLHLYWRGSSKTFWRGSPTCAPGWNQHFPSLKAMQSLHASFVYVILCTAFLSPLEINHREGCRFPYFFQRGGEGTVHKLSFTSTFAIMIRSSYRSRNVLLVKGPHWKWYNVGKQKQNCSHSFILGEVTLTSLFLKMYLYKPSLGLHWLFLVQPWRRANPSRWSSQPNDCQSHIEMTSGFHGTVQQCCEGTSFPGMK